MEGTILLVLQAIRVPFIVQLFAFFSAIANHGFIWLVLGLIFLIFVKDRRKEGLALIASVILCALIGVVLIGMLVGRDRPFDAIIGLNTVVGVLHEGYSFPSFHVASCVAASFIIARCFGGKFGFVSIIFSVIIMFARMYLGVNYPTDVLAGIVLGLIIGWICVFVFMRLINISKPKSAARHSVKNQRRDYSEYHR